jgi:hypothetical protein
MSRGASFMRRGFALLIAAAIALVVFDELTSLFAGDHLHVGGVVTVSKVSDLDLVWALPAIAAGVAVAGSLAVVSASPTGIMKLDRLGLPGLSHGARARANGLTWGAIGMLGVHSSPGAFEGFPGGHTLAAILTGGVLCIGTFCLHRRAVELEAYRTFNLIAMLLAAGSLASMSLTPTGAWWTRNFSTLGTSDDIAAACFNIAIILSGAGVAALASGLTRALAEPRFGVRRGGLTTTRVLIVLIGVSLMGVGLVPIDGASDIHNAAAGGAALSFAVLCFGVQLWARRLPRTLIMGSYAAIVIEAAAMVAYDGMGLFNLTVFEIIAFSLVFTWLIALVAITHVSPESTDVTPAHMEVPNAAARCHTIAGSSSQSAGGRPPGCAIVHPQSDGPAPPCTTTCAAGTAVASTTRRTASIRRSPPPPRVPICDEPPLRFSTKIPTELLAGSRRCRDATRSHSRAGAFGGGRAPARASSHGLRYPYRRAP